MADIIEFHEAVKKRLIQEYKEAFIEEAKQKRQKEIEETNKNENVRQFKKEMLDLIERYYREHGLSVKIKYWIV